MTSIDLTALPWRVRALDGPLPDHLADTLREGIAATLPGVVHLDLLDAGLIPDPLDGANELELRWIGETDWEFSTLLSYTEPDGSRTELVAEGLDTIAEISLDGVVVGTTRNQHRTHRMALPAGGRPHPATLSITFTSPLRYAREREAALGALPHANPHPYNMVRKSAYNFGWDWGPDVTTTGVWRPLRLEQWSGARLAAVHPRTEIVEDAAYVDVEVSLDWAPGGDHEVVVHASIAGAEGSVHVARGTAEVVLRLAPGKVRRWWPRGHGEQTLYLLDVRVDDQEASVGHWHRRIGFRTVRLVTARERASTSFEIHVNDRPVYIRGANWIPDDVFLPRITKAGIEATLAHAVEADLNLLRVWGGGIYESEEFYSWCDEHGMLVWQDFLLACAAYPEDDETVTEITAEAREHIARLTAHPSHVIWNGGNENVWGVVDWGWQEQIGDRRWGERYVEEVFPDLLAELRSPSAYCGNSPWSFHRYRDPNDPRHGTVHIWDVWNNEDYLHYRTYQPRFVSEFGFQGPPNWSTLVAAVHDEPLSTDGVQLSLHQKADDGNLKLLRGLGDHIDAPSSFDDWHFAAQLNQARAIRTGISWFRSQAPRMAGTIVWQLNDCWPVISWSAVDAHGLRKPMWFALREVSAARYASIQDRDGLALFLHNDLDEPWTTVIEFERRSFNGTYRASTKVAVTVGAHGEARVDVPSTVARPAEPFSEVLVADLSSGERALWWFAEDPTLGLSPYPVTASAHADGEGGVMLELTAHSVAKDVVVLADRVIPGARASDGLFTLLPGERRMVRISVPEGHTATVPARFSEPDVVRHAGQLSVGARTQVGR